MDTYSFYLYHAYGYLSPMRGGNVSNIIDQTKNSLELLNDIDRMKFFCSIVKLPCAPILNVMCPSEINSVIECLRNKELNLSDILSRYNSCPPNFKPVCGDQKCSSVAKSLNIQFFIHSNIDPANILYMTSKIPVSVLQPPYFPSGQNQYVYIEGIQKGNINSVMNSFNYRKNSNSFIFSNTILDQGDWFANYAWSWGKDIEIYSENKNIRGRDFFTTPNKFDNWLRVFNEEFKPARLPLRPELEFTDWPVGNEFLFTNPVSLRFCHRIILSDENHSKPIFKLLKRLCPNTFTSIDDFRIEFTSLSLEGENNELINLNYDLIWNLFEENPKLDVSKITDEDLKKFYLDNGIDKLSYYKRDLGVKIWTLQKSEDEYDDYQYCNKCKEIDSITDELTSKLKLIDAVLYKHDLDLYQKSLLRERYNLFLPVIFINKNKKEYVYQGKINVDDILKEFNI